MTNISIKMIKQIKILIIQPYDVIVFRSINVRTEPECHAERLWNDGDFVAVYHEI